LPAEAEDRKGSGKESARVSPGGKGLDGHGDGRAGGAESDAALAARSARGDKLAYAALVNRHLPRVFALTRRMLGNEASAEDAAQEALLRLWTHAGSYDPAKALLTTWLTRIATNVCLDRLRKRQEEQWDDSYDQPLPPDQEKTLEDRQLAERVEAALRRLPDRQRMALVLCHYENLSMAEAARAMDISAEAVESLLGRARRGLRALLASEWRTLLADNAAD
jgi:RNA polymerase sigma-70 factor (ECF subfamily)